MLEQANTDRGVAVTEHETETIEESGYRILVLEPSAKVRRDYQAVLSPACDTVGRVGRDALEAILGNTVALPPGFPNVELILCRTPEESLRVVRQAKERLRPISIAFIELGEDPTGVGLLERLRDLDEAMNIVLVTAAAPCPPSELAERVPPLDQLFFVQKPFHAFEIQQLVLALGARWRAERTERSEIFGRSMVGDRASGDQGKPAFWDRLPAGIVVFDRRDRLVSSNQAARDMFPELLSALTPGTPYEAFQLEQARRLLPKDMVIREEAWLRDRLEWHAKSGRAIDQRLNGERWVLMVEGAGAAGETYCMFFDVSALKRRDRNRSLQERIKQMGRVAEALSSELLKTFWGQEGAEAERPGECAITRLISQLCAADFPGANRERAETLATRLDRIVHPKAMSIARLDANDIVAAAVRGCDLGSNTNIEVVAGAGLWAVDGDRVMLEDCVSELLVNAQAGIQGKGNISVETTNVRVSREFVVSRPSLRPGDFVRITVIDSGTGMRADVADRAMNPFFRADDNEEGMGLGLSEVFAVLERMGAHIEIEAATPTQQGARVSIYLPRSKASAKQGALLASPGPQGKGSAA